ncbi:hypothetical protein [Streptomyces thermoviolaceus]|uniref:hypothetical protein n=1 Tax=Streptomyces thermoviolaceus TaxID=1952 RepID=UPI00167B9FD8|nr:hypothetical protein [Streptomyces thermoviolaceus]GGV80505.1 hypothetical protein GCM10010499_43590 [Streptomyces thermoviolaceus subsp. apingens]
MGFPNTPLDIRTELQIDGVWQRVRTYERDTVVIETGRPDMAAQTDPGSLQITVDNRNGQYSPRNPMSPLYGKIGRNTRIRLSVPGTTSYLQLDGDPANYASTPDTAALDITGDLDLRWEGEADWYAPTEQALIGKWGSATSAWAYALTVQNGSLCALFRTASAGAWVYHWVLPALPRHAALRATLDADNGTGGRTVRWYWAPSLDGPWTLISEYTDSGAVTLATTTSPLSIAPTWTATPFAGRCYRAEVRNGIDGPVVAAPDFTAQAAGTTSFTDRAGRVWTLSGAAAIRDRADLFVGEVSEWPQKWQPDGSDSWVPLQASGILRRMGQGKKALQSTLRRRVPSGGPLAYWPMEDGATATQAASAIDGGLPLTVSGLTFASDDSMPGSDTLPVLGESSSLRGTVTGAKAGGWHVEMVYKLDKMPSTEQTMLTVNLKAGTGGVTQVLARVSTAGIRVQALDADGTVITQAVYSDASAIAAFTAAWNRLQIFSAVNGDRCYFIVAWRNVLTNAWYYAYNYFTGGTPGAVTAVRGSWGSDFQGMVIGHLACFDVGGTVTTQPVPGVNIYEGSDDGFNGETAWTRMRRLATEEGLPLARIPGDLPTEQVGPQRVDTLLNLLQAAADADGGLLLEDRTRPGLLYRERSSMYSQTPKLTLSYNRAPGVAALEPVDDDTAVRNDRTVTRAGGSSARAVLTDGPLSVQDPPDGIGQYDDEVTLSLYSDDQTGPIAYWRLHLGTVDGSRYPTVKVLLHKAPGLIPQVLGLTEGDLIRITDLPVWVGFGHVDLLVDGIHHEMGLQHWEATLNCSPAQPWQVGAVAIVEDFEDTEYAVPITSGGDAPWTRSQAHYNTGTWSLHSGVIGNNQTSDAVVIVPAGATELRFWYYVSSEEAGPGFEGDRLLVLVDGVQVLRAQGSVFWTQAAIDVTGASTVTFRYAKDNSSAVGEDGAWIDDLEFLTSSPTRIDTDGTILDGDVGPADTTLRIGVTADTPWITADEDPGAFPFDILVGGERMTVTAITGTTSLQTFIVVRAVNGVTKAHAAGQPVQLADPAIAAL